MRHLLYDDTYDGFLTCLYHHFAGVPVTGIFPQHSYQTVLTASAEIIPTKKRQARYMASLLERHLGCQSATDVYYAHLSQTIDWENVTLAFVDLCFRQGAHYREAHTHPGVFPFDSLVLKVKMEVHRYEGYVRFRQWGDCLYAKIHPLYFILPALKNHFVDRYHGENIIIHDETRNIALMAKEGACLFVPFQKNTLPDHPPEDPFIGLWKQYVETIAISSRINPKLQRQFVPLKYRKDLVEFQSTTDPSPPLKDPKTPDRWLDQIESSDSS